MVQPKYDDVSDNPIYSVDSDQPAYLCAGWSCATCTETMQAVFSGINGPYACYPAASQISYKITSLTGLNGTHTLTRSVSDDCIWEIADQGAVTVTTYTDAACTTVDTTTDTTFYINLGYLVGAGLWVMFVGVSDDDPFPIAIYSGQYTASETCPNSWTMTNTITSGSGNACTIDEI